MTRDEVIKTMISEMRKLQEIGLHEGSSLFTSHGKLATALEYAVREMTALQTELVSRIREYQQNPVRDDRTPASYELARLFTILNVPYPSDLEGTVRAATVELGTTP